MKQNELAKFIALEAPVTTNDVLKAFPGTKRNAVHNAFHLLVKSGRVKRIGRGSYCLSSQAREITKESLPTSSDSLSAVKIGEGVIDYITMLKKQVTSLNTLVENYSAHVKKYEELVDSIKEENEQLWTDLSECTEVKERLQQKLNDINLHQSQKTLSVDEIFNSAKMARR